MTDHEDREGSVAEPLDTLEKEKSGFGEDSDNRRKGDTKVGLTLRILVAVYVLYLAYGLIQGFGETAGNNRIFIAIAIGVFLIGGGTILVLSVRKLIGKEYVDADEDAGSEKR